MFYIYDDDDDDENQSKLELELLPRSGHFLLGSSRIRINRSVSQIAAALLFSGVTSSVLLSFNMIFIAILF